ncbi:hypothetical protein KY332_02700 [Candidatus Woesearchaeota archaeon]|nr:hypothetical protein [Candidatus Woesearchaeota archaeon]
MKIFLYALVLALLSTIVLAGGDQSSVCFNYAGDAVYYLHNSVLGYHSEVEVTDQGTTIEIKTTLDSVAKPYISYGEHDNDGDGTVEADELRSDGEWIYINGALSYDWIVYGGDQDPEITLTGYPADLEYNPIIYTATIPEPSSGDEVCIDVHHSPPGAVCTECKGLNSLSVDFDYSFTEGDSVEVKVYGAGKTKLKDSETATVSSSNVDNNVGQHDLIIDSLTTTGISMTINSVSNSDAKGNFKDKISPETKIEVWRNGQLIATATKHTSCSEPIIIGDNFDGTDGHLYTITALDEIYKEQCILPPPEEELDFGDAPDSYSTLLASDGARHLAIGPFLGNQRDVEPDGQPTANADGDDINNLDDEDGVVFNTPLIPCQQAIITVTAPQGGLLDAWIDFNQNGVFDHPAEQIFASQPVAGVINLSFMVPCDAELGPTYARFRISIEGGLTPVGYWPNGEVEDYKVTITEEECPEMSLSSVSAEFDEEELELNAGWTIGVNECPEMQVYIFVIDDYGDVIGSWNGPASLGSATISVTAPINYPIEAWFFTFCTGQAPYCGTTPVPSDPYDNRVVIPAPGVIPEFSTIGMALVIAVVAIGGYLMTRRRKS